MPGPVASLDNVCFRQRSSGARLGLTPHEVAVVEVLRECPRYTEVSWDEVVDWVKTLTASKTIDVTRVFQVICSERKFKARKIAAALASALSGLAHV